MDGRKIEELMQWWPRRLGERAEKVIESINEGIYFGSRAGELGKRVNTSAHGTGASAIVLDEEANSEVRKIHGQFAPEVKKRFGLDLVIVGEEDKQAFGISKQIDSFAPDHLVVVADPLDGSTNCSVFGCGYATVLVSFLPRPRGGYELIGGAIADSNGHTIIWNGRNNVFVRHNKLKDDEYHPLTRRNSPSRPAVAAVATSPQRLRETLRYMDQIESGTTDSALLMTMAGTPSAFALCALGLSMVIEPKGQKCWDAAHLYPALMLGLDVQTLPGPEDAASRKISIDQVTSYFGTYLDNFRLEPQLVVPPFYIRNH